MSAKANGSMVVTREFRVTNKLGIHARPAARFVKTANQFDCDIFVERDGQKVGGRSILGLMLLAAGHGSTITIHAHGQDAPQAVAQLEALLERRFDEA